MSLTRSDIINLTLKHEGGYNIDNNNKQVYCGINEGYNSTWPGWAIVNRWVSSLGGVNKARYKKSNDPQLQKLVENLVIEKYWDKHNFESYNDSRIVAHLFDHVYNAGDGGTLSVLRNVYNNKNLEFNTVVPIINSDKQALEKIIQGRKAYYSKCKWHTDNLKTREKYTKAAYKRVDAISAETGSPQFSTPISDINNTQAIEGQLREYNQNMRKQNIYFKHWT